MIQLGIIMIGIVFGALVGGLITHLLSRHYAKSNQAMNEKTHIMYHNPGCNCGYSCINYFPDVGAHMPDGKTIREILTEHRSDEKTTN